MRGQRGTVVEDHAFPQIEQPGLAVEFPAVGQQRRGLKVFVQLDHAFKYQMVDAVQIAGVAADGMQVAAAGRNIAHGQICARIFRGRLAGLLRRRDVSRLLGGDRNLQGRRLGLLSAAGQKEGGHQREGQISFEQALFFGIFFHG